jgi:type I restriction enzyme M protein
MIKCRKMNMNISQNVLFELTSSSTIKIVRRVEWHHSQSFQKLWNYCNVLRDDEMSYGDYVEQFTYLLFLKMADERTKPPYNQPSAVPAKYNWPTLLKKDGDDLFDHYRHMLESLGNEKGLLGLIFNKSQNKFQDPSKLRPLVIDLIDKENWSAKDISV